MAEGARLGPCAVLLRGVNLGSENKVPMAGLRAALDAAGLGPARTYIQSGNVLLTSELPAPALSAAVEELIERELGVRAPALVRTLPELQAVVSGNPYLARGCDESKLHVTFLAEAPANPEVAGDFGVDEVQVLGREAYLHCPDGYGRTKLGNTFLERVLGVVGTTRNWRTVRTVTSLLAG